MRVAVAGGTGLIGTLVVDGLARAGHEPVVLARSHGVDLVSGAGLASALVSVDAVVDVVNTPETEPDAARAFFETATGNLLAAGRQAGVAHHLLLSIVGLDRVVGNGHYAGKRRQEELVAAGATPWTILRATQFFEFPEMVVSWTRSDGVARIPPLLVQPVAAADVATVLQEVGTGTPQRRLELAGPEPQDFVDMARRILAARGDTGTRLIPSWQDGPFGVEMAGEVLLPGPDAWFAATTFEAWLAAQQR